MATKRRTHWQALAYRKYPRFYCVGGDGSKHECWLVLTMCPHQQVHHWRYQLTGNKEEAEALLASWNKDGCHTYTCDHQSHKLWRLS